MNRIPSLEARPLSGKRVLITRALSQAVDLSSLLVEAGAVPVELPTIQIEPPDSWGPVDRAISQLESYRWVIFTSANAVRAFTERLIALGRDIRVLDATSVAAIGSATAEALAAARIRVDFMPKKYVAEAVVEGLVSQVDAGDRVLLPRAAEARELIVDSLRSEGAVLDEVAVYQTVSSGSRSRLQALLTDRELDALTFASSSAVRNLVGMLGETGTQPLASCVVACIGPITAATARDLGLRVDIVPAEYTIPGLVRAMEDYYRRRDG